MFVVCTDVASPHTLPNMNTEYIHTNGRFRKHLTDVWCMHRWAKARMQVTDCHITLSNSKQQSRMYCLVLSAIRLHKLGFHLHACMLGSWIANPCSIIPSLPQNKTRKSQKRCRQACKINGEHSSQDDPRIHVMWTFVEQSTCTKRTGISSTKVTCLIRTRADISHAEIPAAICIHDSKNSTGAN